MLPLKPFTLADLIDDTVFDVVVLGAGGAGMATALFAAFEGARVLLVESTAHVGGSTALSAGTAWVPGSKQGLALNPSDSIDAARRYLNHTVGGRTSPSLRDAFLKHGATALATLESESHARFRARRTRQDFMQDVEGAVRMGRALDPQPLDGRLLGADLALVRPPTPESTVLGGMMVNRVDMAHWQNARRSWASFRHMAKLVIKHGHDRMRWGRGTRLLRGNALVGRMLLSLRERGVTLLTRTRATSCTPTPGGGHAVVLAEGGVTRRVQVKGGVVMATGGFNRNPGMRAARMPNIDMAWCPGAPGNIGTAHPLAEALGATHGVGALSHCYWAPVSLRKRRDGTLAAIPHFHIDRASPRMVAVDARGLRFVNEATSHHLFAVEMQEANATAATIPSYLITDADGMARYGLGMVRPHGYGLASALADGYVISAPTLRGLADKLEIRAAPLTDSVLQFNSRWTDGEGADSAHDAAEHRPSTATDASPAGELDWHTERSLAGPIHKPPFYAVKLYPGDIGAATGFVTDEHARMLDRHGRVLPGLYAVGNDMHSIMGGVAPAPGTHLGASIAFASFAAHDAVARAHRPADGARVYPSKDVSAQSVDQRIDQGSDRDSSSRPGEHAETSSPMKTAGSGTPLTAMASDGAL